MSRSGDPMLGLWATIRKPTGSLVGLCGLLAWIIDNRHEVEVAFLLSGSFWRPGLASEAARAVAALALEVLGLQYVICLVMPGNDASCHVAEPIGMRLERELHDDHRSALLYALECRASDTAFRSREAQA